MSERSARRSIVGVAAALTAGAVAACGANVSNESQASQPTGRFPASVRASFPPRQALAEPSDLAITVTNTGSRTMPNVAVTLMNPDAGPGAQALGRLIAQPAPGQPILASRSRAAWVIDEAPGPCGYSCRQGGPGAAVTAYTNTWALGRLAPGHSATFTWHVTALQPGRYRIAYRIAAGLSGQAAAIGPSTRGELFATISARPRQAYVNNNGQIVYTNPLG